MSKRVISVYCDACCREVKVEIPDGTIVRCNLTICDECLEKMKKENSYVVRHQIDCGTP